MDSVVSLCSAVIFKVVFVAVVGQHDHRLLAAGVSISIAGRVGCAGVESGIVAVLVCVWFRIMVVGVSAVAVFGIGFNVCVAVLSSFVVVSFVVGEVGKVLLMVRTSKVTFLWHIWCLTLFWSLESM